MMKVKLWGVRGSIPCPGPETVKYGGNTASIELRVGEENRLMIIDAGSGIRKLGERIIKHDLPKDPLKIKMFFTHTHWDHILGFPFFIPIFIPGTEIDVYGPVTYEDEGLDQIIGDQLRYRYFPVKHSELSAVIRYHPLREGTMDLGDGLFVTTKYLNHPILCLGYRFEYKGKAFCTAYDHEPFRNVFPTDPEQPGYDAEAAEEGEAAAREENEKVLRFYQNADLLIHDSQYTKKEYLSSKLGWGHSPFETAINNAHKAGVKRLALFHHDPNRTDQQLDALIETFRRRISGKSQMQVEIAREGREFIL
ncbi:MAG TPA: MBL fold metallo-hydrolase [Sediminispirochaeta sp.]|nr:MBL fold metallo-hydrolase [Sediminispirochaeta sp.]